MPFKIEKLKEEEQLPQDFWEDEQWAFQNYRKLRKEYADMWVAIVDKQVVASGKTLTEEQEEAIREKVGRPFPVLFVEGEHRIL